MRKWLPWVLIGVALGVAPLVIGLLVVAARADAADFTLLGVSTRCERCMARCQREACPQPTIPEPTRTPAPTMAPQECIRVGEKWDASYQIGEGKTFCFDMQKPPTPKPGQFPPSPNFEVSTQNHGNASCADMYLQIFDETGAASKPSRGSQPGASMVRGDGRFYVSTKLIDASNGACATFTFTVR